VPRSAGRHAWEDTRVGWHAAFAGVLVLAAALAVFERELDAGRRAAVLALLGGIALLYTVAGVRAFHRHCSPLPSRLYVGGVVPLVVAAFALYPGVGLVFFAVFAQLWALLPTRQAIAATVVLSAAIGVVLVVSFDASPAGAVLQTGVSLTFSLLFGLWISRIIDQSHRRAEVIGELEATRAELAAVSHDAGVLAERERLAREIHDTLAQGFTSVLMLLELAESDVDADPAAARRRLAMAQQTVRQNLAEARSLVAALTPVDLQAAPLPEAVGRVVERFGRERGLPAALAVEGTPQPLPASQEVVLLRAAQEALANVGRHAGSCRVSVTLRYGADGAELAVTDDGSGFVPDGTPATGYGLAGMRRRVEEAGGVLRVDSAPGAGTTVRVSLP
jgi:signal transduction histidine kinase